jgi:RNA-splicing ligase RtcB
MTVKNRMVCPNLVGVDIGCGMYVMKLRERELDFSRLDGVIRGYVPSGFSIHESPLKQVRDIPLKDLLCAGECDLDRAEKSLGTLGGGNHFIEVDRDSNGDLWLVIHSGSRHLGLEVAHHYQALAVNDLHTVPREKVQKTIRELKEQGRQSEIEAAVKSMKPAYASVPDALCWCSGDLFDRYVNDMKITQAFASANRRAMADIIVSHMDLHVEDSFETIHNYLDTKNMILRKGAVEAAKGQRLIIPMNMRDGSLICIGKGNPDWNCSAPHGAGRLMSRSAAKENILFEEFVDSMKDIWTTSVTEATLDESPMAYKPMESIIENISETVDIVDIVKPVYNFKAS